MPKLALSIVIALVVLSLAVQGYEDSSENTLRVVSASHILATLQFGLPVEYDHVIVLGDLDLSELRPQTNITSPIKITDSTFWGRVSFNYTRLDGPIDLTGSDFTRGASFKGVTFSGYTDFTRTRFDGDANFEATTFNGYAQSLKWSFRGVADFGFTTFSRNANFAGATFSKGVNFGFTTFSGNTSFEGAVFNWYTDFRSATFSGNSIPEFYDITFRKDVYFDNITVRRHHIEFGGSIFHGYFFGWDDIKQALFCDDATYLRLSKTSKITVN